MVVKARTSVVLIKSRLMMIKATQPMKVRSIVSVSIPRVSLKKDSSSPKKADPRNAELIRKYVAVAAIPKGKDSSVTRLM
jgi:hypothetical protein